MFRAIYFSLMTYDVVYTVCSFLFLKLMVTHEPFKNDVNPNKKIFVENI